MTLQVRDAHKFCNEDMGVLTLSFHDIREMLTEKTITVDLLDRESMEQDVDHVQGDTNRWQRDELNTGRNVDDEYDPLAVAVAAAVSDLPLLYLHFQFQYIT